MTWTQEKREINSCCKLECAILCFFECMDLALFIQKQNSHIIQNWNDNEVPCWTSEKRELTAVRTLLYPKTTLSFPSKRCDFWISRTSRTELVFLMLYPGAIRLLQIKEFGNIRGDCSVWSSAVEVSSPEWLNEIDK